MTESEEIRLPIYESKSGNKFIKLNDTEEIEAGGMKVKVPILREGKHIIIEKNFEEPREFKTKFDKMSYSFNVKHGDEENVYMTLYHSKQSDALTQLGSVGDKIKISADLFDNKFGGKSQELKFELQ